MYDLIIFADEASLVRDLDDRWAVAPELFQWVSDLGIRGPDEPPFLVLASSSSSEKNITQDEMEAVRERGRFDMSIFSSGHNQLWLQPGLIENALRRFGVNNTLIVGDRDAHREAAIISGCAYLDLTIFLELFGDDL